MKPSFERSPPSEVLIEIVNVINAEIHERAMKVTGHHPRRAFVDKDRHAFEEVIQIASLRFQSCGGDYSAILFLEQAIWDTEDADDREVDESAPGFNYKTDLMSHLKNKMKGMTTLLNMVVP